MTSITDSALLGAAGAGGGGTGPYSGFLVVTNGSDGIPRAYEFSSVTGFGAQITSSSLGASWLNDCAFTSTGDAIVYGLSSSPYIAALAFSAAGFGSRYSNPSTLPTGQIGSVVFSPDNSVIFAGSSSSPYINAYAWNSTTGFGSKYSNPATLPTGNARDIDITTAGDALAVASASVTNPTFRVYPWDNATGFGSAYSIPFNNRNKYSIAFSHNDDAIVAIGVFNTDANDFVSYQWSSLTGIGSSFTDPATVPKNFSVYGTKICFTSDDSVVFFAVDVSPSVLAYPFSSVTGYGAKYADPSPTSTTANQIDITPDDACVAVGLPASPYVRVWPWSPSGFGSAYSNPSTALAATCTLIKFSPPFP